MEEKLTPLKLIDSWLGKGPSKLRVASVTPPKLSREEMERVIVHLLIESYLREDFSFTAYATISYLKTGPKVDLLKNEKHAIRIEMGKLKTSASKDASLEDSICEESDNGTHENDSAEKVDGEIKRPAKKCNFHAKKRKVEEAAAAVDGDADMLIE